MGIFSFGLKFFGRTKLSTDKSDGSYAGGPSRTSQVSSSLALTITTVLAAQNLIGGTIGTLSLELRAPKKDNIAAPALDHPLYYILNADPNYDLTTTEFWEYMSAGIELHGNAYALKSRGVLNNVVALLPINPDPANVSVKRKANGSLEYRFTLEGKRYVEDQEDVLHIRGSMATALGGVSTLQVAAKALRGALSVNDASAKAFENQMRPSGVLSVPRALDKFQRKEVEENLDNKYKGALNAGRPLVLDNGVKWETISMSAADAQLLESRKFSIEDIARIFGVPPFMIGHSEKSAAFGKGLEQQVLAFIKFTLRRRLTRIEKALEKQLLSAAERRAGYKIRFNMEGLLRGDSIARSKFYEVALRMGYMTVNEVRELENLGPVDGGDVPRVQSQNIPLAQANGNPKGES